MGGQPSATDVSGGSVHRTGGDPAAPNSQREVGGGQRPGLRQGKPPSALRPPLGPQPPVGGRPAEDQGDEFPRGTIQNLAPLTTHRQSGSKRGRFFPAAATAAAAAAPCPPSPGWLARAGRRRSTAVSAGDGPSHPPRSLQPRRTDRPPAPPRPRARLRRRHRAWSAT